MERNKEQLRLGLAIGGGGANGGYAVKLLQILNQEVNFDDIKFISGVSVGSLIGAFIVQHDEKILFDTFFLIKNKNIYNGKVSILNLLKCLILRKNHVSDITPLKELLTKYISLDKAKKSDKIFCVGFVDMDKGEYVSKTQHECNTNEEYINLLVASCSQPAIWQPQNIDNRSNCSDGGVLRVSPIGDLLSYNPDKLIIINNSPSKINILLDKSLDKSLLHMILRIIELSINNAFNIEIKQFISYNEILKEVEQKGGKQLSSQLEKKYYDYVIYQYDKFTDSMDFESEELIEIRIKTAISHAIWNK